MTDNRIVSGASELAACPFCGSKAHVDDRTSDEDWLQWFVIMCGECCGSSGWYSTEAEAITAWNARAALASPPEADAVQEAVLAERERCAAYLEGQARMLRNTYDLAAIQTGLPVAEPTFSAYAVEAMAAAIRAPTTPSDGREG